MFSSLSKKDKKHLYYILAIIIAVIFSYFYEKQDKKESIITQDDTLSEYNYVHFLDVGQGDCTLFETADGKFALIDASTQDAQYKIISYLEDRGAEELEFIIFTHPHEDHIGCGDEVIDNFKVKTVYMTDRTENTSCYQTLVNSIMASKEKHGTKVFMPHNNDKFNLGSMTFTVLSDGIGYEDTNDSSICVKAELGESTFIFTGDARKNVEQDILYSKKSVDAEVYKAGHHGSSTSNSDDFLDAVSPELCIISCAEDNSYGHPHVEVIAALEERQVETKRTYFDGDIVVAFDSTNIFIQQHQLDG